MRSARAGYLCVRCRYYLLSLVVAATCEILIWHNWGRHIGADTWGGHFGIVHVCSFTFCIAISLPFIDAAPRRLLSQRVRIVLYAAAAALFLYSYINTKMSAADIYENQGVPELKVEGFVELSALDCYTKAYLTIGVLAVHTCYRAWRYPTQAVLVQSGYARH